MRTLPIPDITREGARVYLTMGHLQVLRKIFRPNKHRGLAAALYQENIEFPTPTLRLAPPDHPVTKRQVFEMHQCGPNKWEVFCPAHHHVVLFFEGLEYDCGIL